MYPAIPMAQLTSDEVRHIAKLARLNLSDDDIEKYTKELTSILSYIDLLKEVDTKDVPATAQVTGVTGALQEDALRTEELADPDALLHTSPLPIVDHQIETPSAHG